MYRADTDLKNEAGKGEKLTILADGKDEREAVEALKDLVDNSFGK